MSGEKNYAKTVFDRAYDIIADYTDEVPVIHLSEKLGGSATAFIPTPIGLVVIQASDDGFSETTLTPDLLAKMETVVRANKKTWIPTEVDDGIEGAV